MIRKIGLFVALIAFMATSAYAAVPDRTGKWDAGVNVSGAIPDEDGTDSAVYVGGTASYGFNNWFALGVSSGWAEFDEEEAGITADDTAIPLFADLIFRIPMQAEQQFQPYGVIGLGVIFWDIDTNIPGLEIDADDAFAAKFGGGVDWFVNDNWIVNFEFSYVTSDTDSTATLNGASISADVETDFWMVGGGLKYLFS